jgi:hypothetical protein
MKSEAIETGDLELSALGILSEERKEVVLSALNTNEGLRSEYLDIQRALLNLALENGIAPPENLEAIIKEKLFKDNKTPSFSTFYKKQWFKIAAALLIIGSIAGNLFSFKEEIELKNLSEKNEVIETEQLVNLPFDKSIFEDMFKYLEKDLMINPCKMDYSSTQAFLESKGLNTEKNLEFLKNHHAHCDCEVLMNVSQIFEGNYSHGQVPPVSHRSVGIKLSYFQNPFTATYIAFNAENGKLLL